MNKRKFFGTILGIIFWSVCVVFFTFAYYEWKSENTSIVLGINDLSIKCMPGTDVNVSNIGPVLNYEDGVISEFSIENGMDKEMAIDLRLDITSISDNLLVESFKYAVVTDTAGGTNYDYANPVIEGTFENFNVGSNVITTALVITPSITQSFQFIVYIDGNMKNDINMQRNNLAANLMIGNCEENATSMDEMAYQAIYSNTDNSLTFIYNKRLEAGDIYNNKAVTAVYIGFETATYSSGPQVPWYSVRENIETVNFEEIIRPKSTAIWFYGFSNLTNINLEKLDTRQVTSMWAMFSGCSNLEALDVSNFDTSNVTNMSYMFQRCVSLLELDVSNFNTSKVTNMGGMFAKCSSLTSLDLSSFDTSNVTDMSHMFAGVIGSDISIMKLITIDLSNFDTSKVTSMTYMFFNCRGLKNIDLSNFNTSKVTNMAGMFYFCHGLEELDLSNFDTSNVTNMEGMFQYCNNLKSLNVSKFNTKNVTSMSAMFYNCINLISIDVSNWDTSNVTNMAHMFANELTTSKLNDLDVSNFDTSNVTNMSYMFQRCVSLTTLDLKGWDTSNVTNMRYMFNDCYLTSLDLSGFETDNVEQMTSMFYGAAYLKEINLSGWNIEKVTDMSGMFAHCTMLETIVGLEDLNTSNVTSMGEYLDENSKLHKGMFALCSNLTATITIRNSNTTYDNIFYDTSTTNGTKITVNYISATESLVDNMIETKSDNSNVIKGVCVDCEEETTE